MTEFSLITKKGLRDGDPVPMALLTELKLNTLFCGNTLEILSHPCGAEDILARQEIFRILEKDIRAKEQFTLLYKKLAQFSKTFDRYNKSDNDCVRLFVFRECVACFFSLIDADLPAGSYFCGRLSAYFAELKKKSGEMQNTFAEYAALLDKISGSRIVFSPSGYYLAEDTGGGQKSALDLIVRDADALGWGRDRTDDDKKITFVSPFSKYLNALYPESFDKLTQLERSLYDGIDFNLLSLISEMDFYFEVSELIKKADRQNIPHTYPTPAENPSFSADELYDITLISAKAEKIVPNNVFISPEKRCFYICGANGGGKTTYLRAVASQLIMFLGGCPIFCRSAMIYTYTKVFGHFPQDEDSAYYGRLDREINAVSEIIGKCDDESFVFLNETFSGGTQSKATELALSAMDQLSEKGSCCLFVTHLYDVYKSAYPVLSPVVANDLSHTRTYQIGLSDKPGGSYAGDILKKYDLDEKSLGDDS